jgi:hypothetical protein
MNKLARRTVARMPFYLAIVPLINNITQSIAESTFEWTVKSPAIILNCTVL